MPGSSVVVTHFVNGGFVALHSGMSGDMIDLVENAMSLIRSRCSATVFVSGT